MRAVKIMSAVAVLLVANVTKTDGSNQCFEFRNSGEGFGIGTRICQSSPDHQWCSIGQSSESELVLYRCVAMPIGTENTEPSMGGKKVCEDQFIQDLGKDVKMCFCRNVNPTVPCNIPQQMGALGNKCYVGRNDAMHEVTCNLAWYDSHSYQHCSLWELSNGMKIAVGCLPAPRHLVMQGGEFCETIIVTDMPGVTAKRCTCLNSSPGSACNDPDKLSTTSIVLIVVGVIVFLLVIVCILCCIACCVMYKKKKEAGQQG